VALALLASWAGALAFAPNIEQLLNYSTVGDWLGMAFVIGTLFWYHRRQPDATVSFRVPFYPLLPLAFLFIVLWIITKTVMDSPRDAGMGILITLAGLPVYWIWRYLLRARA